MIRKTMTVAAVALAVLGWGMLGCGSSPCGEYCDFSCNRAVECEMTGASASTVDECVSQCTELAEELFTSSACEAAKSQYENLSCEDFLAAMGDT